MKTRIHLKHHRKKSKRTVFLSALFFVFLLTIAFLYLLSSKIWPVLMSYAELEAEKITMEIINQTIDTKITNQLDTDQLFLTTKNTSGEIQTIDYNPVTVNKVLSMTNQSLQEILKALENKDVETLKNSGITLDDVFLEKVKKGIIGELPIGLVTQNALLSNLGPSIPTAIHFVGSVNSNLYSEMNHYGINNVMVQTFMKVEVKVQVLLPLAIQEVPITVEIPIAIKMIQGKVPTYYQNGFGTNSNLLSLPIQE